MARKRKKAGPTQEAEQAAPKPPPKVATQLGALLAQAGVKPAPKSVPRPAPKLTPTFTYGMRPAGPNTLPPPAPEPAARVSARPPSLAAGAAADTATVAGRSGSELRLLNDAYAGARPLAAGPVRRPVTPFERVAQAAARDAVRSEDRVAEAAARTRLDALVAGSVRFNVQRDDAFVHGLRSDASVKLLSRLTGKSFAAEASLDLHGRRAAEVARLVSEFVRTKHRSGARSLLIIAGKGLHSEGGVGVLGGSVVDALVQGGAAPLVLAFATPHDNHGGSGAIAVLLQS